MKVFISGFIAVLVIAVVTFFLPKKNDLKKDELLSEEASNKSLTRETEANKSSVHSIDFEKLDDKAIQETLENLLLDADISTDQYLILINLLKANESLVLKLLAEQHYPENMEVYDPRYKALEMIERAIKVHYSRDPLAGNLEKMETLRPTGSLFSTLVSTLIHAAEGVENTETAYDWIMSNADDTAAAVSGTRMGAMLVDFTPEQAWEKIINLPEGDSRAGALNAFMGSDIANNVDTMVDYINSTEHTPDLDHAIGTLLDKALQQDYDYKELVPIAAAPIDRNHRMSSLGVLFNKWASEDPNSLKVWSEQQHDFTLEQRAEISLIAKQALQGNVIEF